MKLGIVALSDPPFDVELWTMDSSGLEFLGIFTNTFGVYLYFPLPLNLPLYLPISLYLQTT